MDFCTRCYERVEPRRVKTPTFAGYAIVEYYCPKCGKLLEVGREEMSLPVRRGGRGVCIAVDGIEGSGKTTQVERLAERLRTGCRVVKVKEPYLLEVRRIVRERDVDVEAEVLLYVADRIIMQRELLIPSLEEGAVVIGDRSPYATVAYQSALGYPEDMGYAPETEDARRRSNTRRAG
ncbi:MAG: dTMP kinase [Pyrobaculum sp.]